jgi:hypothetical protein
MMDYYFALTQDQLAPLTEKNSRQINYSHIQLGPKAQVTAQAIAAMVRPQNNSELM